MPASRATSEAPSRMRSRTHRGSRRDGKPTTLSAKSGFAPIAYTSLREFAALIAPKSKGSSAIGVKKSTVVTRARSSRRR